MAVGADEISLAVEAQVARAGESDALVGQEDAQKSLALDREVELALRGLELAGLEELLGRLEPDAGAEAVAVKKVGGRRADALVADAVDVGKVAGDDVDLVKERV